MNDRVAMLVSVLTRMGAGLLVFVLMARGLGPESYGLVATIIAIATLVSLLTDFGFAAKTLRDIAADPGGGGDILNASLNVKICLTVLALLVGGGVIWVAPVPVGTRPAVMMLSAAVLIGAIGDLAFTSYRAVGRYAQEAWLTLWTSAVHLVVIGWIALAQNDLTLLGAAYLLSRLFYAGLALWGAMALFPGTRFHLQVPKDILTTTRGAWKWAADSGLSYLNSQLDGLMVVGVLGLEIAGIYQSGARFVQAALGIVSVLANIHIPRIAQIGVGGAVNLREGKMVAEFCVLGAILGGVFWVFGPTITMVLLGPEYAAVNVLWPGFGAFVFMRYVAASLGVTLIAMNRPTYRLLGQAVATISTAVGLWFLLPSLGLIAAPWVLAVGSFGTVAVYLFGRFARPLPVVG